MSEAPKPKATFSFVSLGCPKNLVDSERMLGLLAQDGYVLVPDARKADLVIINTCGFIDAARQESLGVIREMLDRKRDGEIKGVVGGKLRDHIDDVRRNRALNRLLRDVELPVTIADLEVRPMDAQAVRDIFARLEFKTLIPRVAELAGIEQQMAAVTSAAAVPMPAPQEFAPDALASWLGAADGEVGVTIQIEGGLPARAGFATPDTAVETPWTPEVATAIAGHAPSFH